MSLLDSYQNIGKDLGGEFNEGDPTAIRRKRAEIERQIVILDSDLKKIVREIKDLEAQRRKFKKDEERIRIERDALDIKLEKIEDNRRFLEEEIMSLKKKLKTIQ